VRAVVLDAEREPALAEIPSPDGEGELVEVLACGLCGSDVEKIGVAQPGTVLGHEVVARTEAGERVALVHHEGCGDCRRCTSGHETTCERFAGPTIVPGGLAERARSGGWVTLPDGVDDAHGTYVEPLACVLRAADLVPHGRIAIVGYGFVGRLFAAVLSGQGDQVSPVDRDPRRAPPTAAEPADHAVVCAPGALGDALECVEPGGTVLVFADPPTLDAAAVYRRELTLIGSRSATRRHMEDAVALLPALDVPEPTVLPLARFAEGLDRYRRREALKVVFTP
jgi:L-iditol 2-dehydrogenase